MLPQIFIFKGIVWKKKRREKCEAKNSVSLTIFQYKSTLGNLHYDFQLAPICRLLVAILAISTSIHNPRMTTNTQKT